MPTEHPALALIVHAGSYERVRFALATAAAAAAASRPTTLFFTMDACYALTPERGWQHLASTQGAEEEDRTLQAKGIAGMEDLLSACVELGVRIIACEMGLRAHDLERDALREDLSVEEGGIVSLLSEDSGKGQILFI